VSKKRPLRRLSISGAGDRQTPGRWIPGHARPRELLRRGLAAEGVAPPDARLRSSDFGVTDEASSGANGSRRTNGAGA